MARLQSGANWPDSDILRPILTELTEVADHVDQAAKRDVPVSSPPPGNHRASEVNLLHYLALRGRDMRPLQTQLAALGLSSLGRSEAHVQWSLEAVLRNLRSLLGEPRNPARPTPVVGFDEGHRLLARHSEHLLGALPPGRSVRIMVTMQSEAATDTRLVADLLAAGMDCARINTAHDGPEAWRAMIASIRESAAKLGRPCSILMDLSGPKLRTGEVAPGPPVVRIRPTRDMFGRVVAVARIWLAPAEHAPPPDADVHVPVAAEWVATLRAGESIRLTDARGRDRTWHVGEIGPNGASATADRTAYVTDGTVLHRAPSDRGAAVGNLDVAIRDLPRPEGFIRLNTGDRLRVTRDQSPGRDAEHGKAGVDSGLARVGCTLPEVFADVKSGERIWFDDGKIGGLVETATPDELTVVITQASERGDKLRSGKGINLPDSDLHLSALGEDDLAHLDFVAAHADLVGLSFVHDPADIREVIERLGAVNGRKLGIILKIETKRGFEALPSLLRAALAAPASGVMVARGDLAVECGFERMAEIQEEILWISEAAHMPVIWATQVLETLAQTGRPSRAEITDAAMGQRAECVMLNKGPHIVDAVRTLDDILRRMQEHQQKRKTLLRQLHSWTTAHD